MSQITHISQLDLQGIYTYADYLLWALEERVELIKGHIFRMSPAPGTRHQRISWKLSGIFFTMLRGHSCEAFSAPFDVRLPDKNKSAARNQDIYTVVQPDLCIVCDRSKLDDRGCIGAPDLVVEILSKGTSKKDTNNKFALYEETGVQEYWIVFPDVQVIQQFVANEESRFVLKGIFADDQIINSYVFPQMSIDLAEVFAE